MNTGRPLPLPATIWIYAFAGSPADVPPGTDFASLSTEQRSPPTPEEIATAKQIADQLHARFQAQGWAN